MGYINNIFTPEQTSPTMTDRYHFTTGYGYYIEGRADNPAVAYIFGRKEAEGGGYTVEAGIEGIIDIVKRWKNYGLTAEDREWLNEQGYPQDYINYIHDSLTNNAKIRIDVTKKKLFFPQEPVVRIRGPIALIKMLESINLCLENGQSAYATHATRMVEVLEREVDSGAPKGVASVQGLRRGPGLGAAIEASRGLLLGGYKSTSTGRAAEMLGAKFAGTMDHAWVQTHKHQLNKQPDAPTMKELFQMQRDGRIAELQKALSDDAFRSYAFTNPNGGIFLTDTYSTLVGIEDAITVIKELRSLGLGKSYGMRFDSDDLIGYSKVALRRMAERNENGDLLDALPAGINISNLSNKDFLGYAEKSSDAPFCAVSDGVDVYTAQQMRESGAYIKGYGIGTAGSHVAPLGLVQKVSAMYMEPLNGAPMPEGSRMTPTSKIVSAAPAKSSNPGFLNSRRFYGDDGKLKHIVIYDEDLGFDEESKMMDLRDFSNQIVNPGGTRYEDILEPVFDDEGRYVYREPPKKPDHPGSSFMVTDLESIAAEIRAELKELPDGIRTIHRPRDEILKEKLMRAFREAKKNGGSVTLNVAELESELPPQQKHIPVYLDALLYRQRLECENRHALGAHSTSVGAYTERFEHS